MAGSAANSSNLNSNLNLAVGFWTHEDCEEIEGERVCAARTLRLDANGTGELCLQDCVGATWNERKIADYAYVTDGSRLALDYDGVKLKFTRVKNNSNLNAKRDRINIQGCDTFTQIVDKRLAKGMGYANARVGEKDALLVASGTFDAGGARFAIDAEAFIYVKGAPTKIGEVESGGTAYPLATKAGKIYSAGNHWVKKYALLDERLTIMEEAWVNYDKNGTATYRYSGKDGGEHPRVSSGRAKEIFYELWKEYFAAEPVKFEFVR